MATQQEISILLSLKLARPARTGAALVFLTTPPHLHMREGPAIVRLTGEIGTVGGGDFEAVRKQIGDAEHIQLYVDSAGGDSICGTALRGLFASRHTIATITGFCGSSAYIAATGAHRIMAWPGARVLVHPPANFVLGTAAEFRAESKVLARLTRRWAAILKGRAGVSWWTAWRWMKAEHWFTAKEALKAGLIDSIIPEPAEPAGHTALSSTKGAGRHEPGLTESELRLLQLLRAMPEIETTNPERLAREVGSWLTCNLKRIS